MTAVNDVTGHHLRCIPHLARLAVLAHSQDDVPLPAHAAEVAEAAYAVLAEADAAGRWAVASTAAGQQARVAEFLAARLARLAAVASGAVTAAGDGDATALRMQLRQFDALTAALWTVHQDVAVRADRQSATPTACPGSRM